MKEILVAALIGLITSRAQALDPTRAISQYAHTAWRNRDGCFASAPSAITQTKDGYGGFDYTTADCQCWMREIGFKETRVEHLVSPDSMVVGIK